jgi:hypothetical protein
MAKETRTLIQLSDINGVEFECRKYGTKILYSGRTGRPNAIFLIVNFDAQRLKPSRQRIINGRCQIHFATDPQTLRRVIRRLAAARRRPQRVSRKR